MNILGLCWDIASSAAISINNKIEYAASEERFSRIKSDEQYPLNAIDDAIRFCKISPDQLDKIVIGGREMAFRYYLLNKTSTFSVGDLIELMEKYWRPKLQGKDYPDMLELFENKIDMSNFPFNSKELMTFFPMEIDHHDYSDTYQEKTHEFIRKSISAHIGVPEKIIGFIDHHSCHATYGFYSSPIRDDGTLVFTVDSYGDGLSGTISRYNKKEQKIERLKSYSIQDFRLGRIYRLTTLLLRMLPGEHEYKVMGLAAYYNGPQKKQVQKIFEEMQTIDGTDFKFDPEIKNIYDHLETKLKNFRFDHIAAGLQSFTEDLLIKWIENSLKEFGGDVVVLSGGVSMNIKANQKIWQIPNITKFFVSGGGADLSLAIGACYHEMEQRDVNPAPLDNMYLGPSIVYDEMDVKPISDKYSISEFKNVKQILDKILDGKIIASCLGRAEFGPRALGNRSILADPRKQENVEIINKKIKNRDFWMPFAPIILHEFQDQIIINPKKIECPYMTIGFETINGNEKIPAAIHKADHTVRPLILKNEHNPKIWELTNLFYEKTGIPALLNTSFNLHGKPIVNSFSDALSVFEQSDLDVLWLDNHIIEKI